MQQANCPFDVTPYDVSGLLKTPTLVNLVYTNQDYESMKLRLIGYIKEKFPTVFNDIIESDLAIMLIENWAFIADTLSFKMDQIANEIFIDTVSEVDNAFRLAMLVGFRPQPPIGATSLWSATINNVLDTDLIISTPVSIPITTDLGQRTIELYPADSENQPLFDHDIMIPAGTFQTTAIVGCEGRTYLQSSTGTGESNQYVQLNQAPVIWNSIRVSIDGQEWEHVDYFTDSKARKEFRIEYDPNYAAFVIFGNSRAGLLPPVGSSVEISYRVGGGTAGHITTGAVQLSKNYVVPGFDFRVPVSFTNYSKGENGYEGDTLADIKRKLPPWLRAQNRIVSGDDIETFAGQFVTEFSGQIGKARASLRNHGCAANVIDLFVLAKGEGQDLQEAGSQLKVFLQEAMTDKKMLTDKICIKDGVIIEVDVEVDVVLDKFFRKLEEEIRIQIERRIDNFFLLNNWNYGDTLKASDIENTLSDLKQLNSIDVNLQTDEEDNSGQIVVTRYYEIVRPATVAISFVYE